MRVSVFNFRPSAHVRAFAVLALFLLLTVVVQAQQSLPPTPAWYYPVIDSKNVERGDFSELKGKRRLYVSLFTGSSPAEFAHTLKRQVFEQLGQFNWIEVVDTPESAEMAIHISIGFPYGQKSTNSPFYETARKQDINFYVLLRGKSLGKEIYNSRVVYKRTGVEREGDSTGIILQIGSLIDRLRKL